MVRENGSADSAETEWVLGELLGIGGNAAVFEGVVPQSRSSVLRFTLFDGQKEREALCDEQRGLRLQHQLQLRDGRVPRIHRIIDWGVYSFKYKWSQVSPQVSCSLVDVESRRPQGVCSVHERCVMDLERWWWDSPARRTEENARRIIRRAAVCLEFLHQEHVIHFDIKLSNFFIPKEDDLDSLQIADFGYARSLDGISTTLLASNEDKTAIAPDDGNCMAPELDHDRSGDRHRRCTTKVDVFSLGMMMLLMATTRMAIHPGTRFRELWVATKDDGISAAKFMNDIDDGNVCAVRRTSFRTNQCESVPVEWAPWVAESDTTSMKALLVRLLALNPLRRMAASAVGKHEWVVNQKDRGKKRTKPETRSKCLGEIVAIVGCVPQKWCWS